MAERVCSERHGDYRCMRRAGHDEAHYSMYHDEFWDERGHILSGDVREPDAQVPWGV